MQQHLNGLAQPPANGTFTKMAIWFTRHSISRLHIINGLLAIVVSLVALWHMPAAIRLSALVGSVWLAAILLAPLLAFWLQRWPHRKLLDWHAKFAAAAKQRKQLGLWAAAWLLAHAIMSIMVYFGNLANFIALLGRQPVTILEAASLSILLLLAGTSNNWSRLHVPGWKYIHLAVWAIPGMVIVSSVMAARQTLGQLPLLGLVPLMFVLCVLAGAVGFATLQRRQFTDWLRAAFLVVGCLAAYVVWNAA